MSLPQIYTAVPGITVPIVVFFAICSAVRAAPFGILDPTAVVHGVLSQSSCTEDSYPSSTTPLPIVPSLRPRL